MNARHDYAGPFSGLTRPVLSAGHTDIAYVAGAAACFAQRIPRRAPNVAVHAQAAHLLSLAERAVRARRAERPNAGWEDDMMELAPGELGVWLDERGETAALGDERGALGEAERQLMQRVGRRWSAASASCCCRSPRRARSPIWPAGTARRRSTPPASRRNG